MTALLEREGQAVAKPKKPPPVPEPIDDRTTVLNVKGSTLERDELRALSVRTGVSISEIARRGIAMWAVSRGLKPPDAWVAE